MTQDIAAVVFDHIESKGYKPNGPDQNIIRSYRGAIENGCMFEFVVYVTPSCIEGRMYRSDVHGLGGVGSTRAREGRLAPGQTLWSGGPSDGTEDYAKGSTSFDLVGGDTRWVDLYTNPLESKDRMVEALELAEDMVKTMKLYL